MDPGDSGQYADVRFTAPAAGDYSWTAHRLDAGNSFPTTTDVHVLVNSISVADGFINLNGGGNTASFSSPEVALPAGGTVDFVVGWGNGDASYDGTGLFATVTAVPEPSSLTLLGLGVMSLLATGWTRSRRRRFRNDV